LDLRLQRLTAMGVREIGEELQDLAGRITDYLDILRSRERIMAIIADELRAVRDEFATPRRSEIVDYEGDLEDEDLIEREEMVVTVTHGGYIKRTPLDAFRAQRRGGKGRAGMGTKDEDAVTNLFVTSTHTPVLFFSTHGKVYRLKVWRLPEGAPQARGRPMVNLLPLAEGETISTVLPLPEDEAEWKDLHVIFATASGGVRRNSMDAFANVPSNGKIAMKFGEDSDDRLIGVALVSEEDDVLLATRQGKAIRFAATDVREFAGRESTGVRGISLREGDEVISLSILKGIPATVEERDAYLRAAPWKENDNEPALPPERMAALAEAEEFILTVTENGYGKRTSAYEYRRTNRGGQGITNIETSERNGCVVASFPARNGEQLMLVTDQAKLIRTTVGDIRIAGRNTQGVTIFRVAENEHVVSAARIDEEEEPENEAEELVAGERAGRPAGGDPAKQVRLDDGTGPDTLPDSQEEGGEDEDGA
ncbi:MAG: DNA gyrase subunit A, partial [Pseudomonadota bacterium]|nr:DNA gyrase subunit A [Pseudomonadota bacterium]